MSTAKPRGKRIALFCLTPGGKALAEKIRPLLPMTCYTSEKLVSDGFEPFRDGFAATLRQAFAENDALIVIGATGITVRVLAPVIQDKMSDPAVIVMDEKGQHVISLLSGHLGGVKQLGTWPAGRVGGQAGDTTAPPRHAGPRCGSLEAGVEGARDGPGGERFCPPVPVGSGVPRNLLCFLPSRPEINDGTQPIHPAHARR